MAYADFKSYIQEKYSEYLQREVVNFISKDYQYVETLNASMCDLKVDNLEVKFVRCTDMPEAFIKNEINLTADIVVRDAENIYSEIDRKQRLFTVVVVACLKDGMDIVEDQTNVSECPVELLRKTTFWDEFGIPCFQADELENIANDFFETCCQDAIYYLYHFPYDYVIERLGIKAYEADLPENTIGRMYFKEDNAMVYQKFHPRMEAIKLENVKIEPGTMLISKDNYFMIETGCYTMTIAHEIVHWCYHQKFFKILSLLGDNMSMMSCDVEPIQFNDGMTNLQKAMWFVEWQANALGMRIAMPQALFVQALQEAYDTALKRPRKGSYYAEVWEDTIHRVAMLFDVSDLAAKQRAIQLGWDIAAGTHLYIDGKIHSPFIFRKGTLGLKQTFIIDKEGIAKVCEQNPVFNELLSSGEFVYIGYVVCINNDKYIREAEDYEKLISGYDYELTDYARNHVDECCLIFDWESVSGRNDDGGFYGQCYLSKDISAHNRVEHYYDPKFQYNQDIMKIAEEVKKYKEAFAKEDEVEKTMYINDECHEFSKALESHMKRKKITVENLALNSRLSTTTIKKYRSGESKPDIDNIMAIFIGLNLAETYCDNLLDICGISLNGKSLKHKVYRMLIREHSDGNIEQWNTYLTAFGLDTIPNQRNQKKSENSD